METTMNTLMDINTRQPWIFGLAALGLALAAPAQAAPDFMDGGFIVATSDRGDEARPDRRDTRKNKQASEGNKRRASEREAEREEPQGYGYGYERRQQKQIEDGSRSRGRR